MRCGILLSVIALLACVEVGRADILWTDWAGNNNVWRAGLDGSDPTPVIVGQFSDPQGIALDLVHGKMYIADEGGEPGVGSDPRVIRANLDGSGIEVLAAGGRPTDVALDVAGGKMYWTDWVGANNVWRANLDGSNPEVLITGQLSDPSGIALDLVHGKMYITDEGGDPGVGSDPAVIRANLDGTEFEILVTSSGHPSGVAVDEVNGKLYWTDWVGANNVWRANLDGSNPEVLITGQLSDPSGIDVDPLLGKIYLADTGGVDGVGSDPSISRANLDGSGVELLFTGGRPSDVAIVPEPSTALLLGALGLLAWSRRSGGAKGVVAGA